MANLTVLYDYYEDKMKAETFVLFCRRGELDWNRRMLRLPLTAPFRPMCRDDYMDGSLHASVLLEDLTVCQDLPHAIGIDIGAMKRRYEETGLDLSDVCRLMIRMEDIEEVMQVELSGRYSWIAPKRKSPVLQERQA